MPNLLVSDKKGKIFVHPTLKATGMKANFLFRLKAKDLIRLPEGSRLFLLPDRSPVGYDPSLKNFVAADGALSVCAFTPPGYTVTYNSAYREHGKPRMLPLFSYAAVAVRGNDLYAAAIRVDRDKRHDSRFIDIGKVRSGIKEMKRAFPRNRLVRHLAGCALVNCCPNAQNLFLKRFEAPLPVSPFCNAACAGCISYQPSNECAATQPRIAFVPTPQEVSEVALYHITNAADPIVSFGQGCEGEPLIFGGVIEESIKLIRKKTSGGTINMNTNGSKPDVVARLLDAGLDNIRVSLNSVREKYYAKYYNPYRYCFADVMRSIKISVKNGSFVSINYLTVPGFTDSKDEFSALRKFIRAYRPGMIQWRNLNFDPALYFKKLGIYTSRENLIGIKEEIGLLRKEFPALSMGYFNPSKRKTLRR